MDINELLDQWRDALLADGWQADGIYGDYAPDKSAKFERDGFVVHIYRAANSLSDGSISAWGPDRLALELPGVYDFAQMQDNMNKCMECGAHGETQRVGFAGRVCAACRIKLLPTHEYPGWTA